MTTRHRLLPFLRPYWPSFAIGLVCAIVSTVMTMLIPRVLKSAVDALGQPDVADVLRRSAAIMVLLAAVAWWTFHVMRRRVYYATRNLEHDIRQALFAALSRLPEPYLSASRTGEVVSRVVPDLEAACIAIGPSTEAATISVLNFLFGAAFLVALDPKLTLMALLPVVPGLFLLTLFARTVHTRFASIRTELATLHATVQESLAGVRLVKAYAGEQTQVALFDAANERYVQQQRHVILLQSVFYPAMALLLSLAWLPLIWYGGTEVIRGRLTRGDFVAFVAYIPLLMWPTVSLGWFINGFQRGAVAWARVRELFEQADEAAGATRTQDAAEAPAIRGRLDIRNLSYTRNGMSVLRDLSLSLSPGDRVSLVGASGSGKTSLLHLITRLLEPPAGAVFVDDRDVLGLSHASLREAVTLVQQDPFIFSGTIEQNVLLGLVPVDEHGLPVMSDTDRATLRWALRIAALDRDILDFPAGTATIVGERGVTLSGGQKQRLSLARALVRRPRLLLLDDALSAVDGRTESDILSRMREELPSLAVLTVTNRVRSTIDALEILVLDRGRIVERGRHDHLLALDGRYAAMFRRECVKTDLGIA